MKRGPTPLLGALTHTDVSECRVVMPALVVSELLCAECGVEGWLFWPQLLVQVQALNWLAK